MQTGGLLFGFNVAPGFSPASSILAVAAAHGIQQLPGVVADAILKNEFHIFDVGDLF